MLLNLANGGKNWTKEEIKERLDGEVQPVTDGIEAPSFLTTKQKKEFNRIAGQLQRLKVMGETDCDTLARYIVAQELYVQAVKDVRNVRKDRPKDLTADGLMAWTYAIEKMDKRVDRYYKQATSAATALGLTISSRCKLVVPVKDNADPKQNKFKKFEKAGNG
jgi:P27 family predicted phage terminase small subunit